MHKFAKLFVESTEMQGGLEVKSSPQKPLTNSGSGIPNAPLGH